MSRRSPNGDPNPSLDDVQVDGNTGRPCAEAGGHQVSSRRGERTLALIDSLMRGTPVEARVIRTAFAPQFAAIDASKVLVDLGPGHHATSNCRPATARRSARPRPAGPAARSDLPQPGGRDPAPAAAASRRWPRPTRQRRSPDQGCLPSAQRSERLERRRPAEGWKVIDRVFTKAEARYIPNGPAARPTWLTRRAPAIS